MEKLDLYIESLIFASESAITFEEIKEALNRSFESDFPENELLKSLERIDKKFADDSFSFELVEISNGYQFMTKGAYHHVVGEYLKIITKRRLSKTALETLSIIAYKQPVTKPEIEQLRGVSSDYSIQKLLEKNLIEIKGRDEGPGRPLVYATSQKFLDYFGLKSMKDLPSIKDFAETENKVGEPEISQEEE